MKPYSKRNKRYFCHEPAHPTSPCSRRRFARQDRGDFDIWKLQERFPESIGAARLMGNPLGAGISALASFIALLLPRASPTLFRGIMSTSRAEPVW